MPAKFQLRVRAPRKPRKKVEEREPVAAEVEFEEPTQDVKTALPPIEKLVRQVSDLFNERMLGAPAQDPSVLDMELEEEDDEEEE